MPLCDTMNVTTQVPGTLGTFRLQVLWRRKGESVMAGQLDPALRKAWKQTTHVAVVCLLALLLLGPAVPARAEAPAPDELLQFTSGGHILGFGADGVVAATGSHAYRVQFVNAAAAPVADTPPAEGGSGALP
jgi:hypothetical protein